MDDENGSKYWKNQDLWRNPSENPFSSTYPPRSGFATRNDIRTLVQHKYLKLKGLCLAQ